MPRMPGIARRRFVWSAAAGTLVALAARPGRLLAQNAKVTWRYVAFAPRNGVFTAPFAEFERQVKERTNGEMQIAFAGGPEAIGPFQAVEAVSKGVFQIALTSANFYASSLPEALALLSGNSLPIQAVRASGAFQLIDELHRQKLGVRLLGCPQGGVGYLIISKQPIRTLADFKGKRFRSLPLYDAIFKAFGAATVTTPPSEAYSALERGVVDGLGWTEFGIEEYRFHEHAKFLLRPTFYTVRANHVVNLAAFSGLPAPFQRAIEEASAATEQWGGAWTKKQRDKETADMIAKGAQTVELSPAEAKTFLAAADDGMWANLHRLAPQNADRLKQAFYKAMQSDK
jgi:TRAP-type C4-dicarboxylate transport system substrate-binding protein